MRTDVERRGNSVVHAEVATLAGPVSPSKRAPPPCRSCCPIPCSKHARAKPGRGADMAVRDRAGRQRRAPLEPPRPPRLSPRQLRRSQTPIQLQQRAPRRALPALRHSLCRSHRTRWPPSSSAPPRALVPLAASTTPRRLDRKHVSFIL